jgi:hypothetical protein
VFHFEYDDSFTHVRECDYALTFHVDISTGALFRQIFILFYSCFNKKNSSHSNRAGG